MRSSIMQCNSSKAAALEQCGGGEQCGDGYVFLGKLVQSTMEAKSILYHT
jgi:NAD(P)H-hydrate repair Nnr-like enzyme with NAD(P)H-hydrate epimerase domain